MEYVGPYRGTAALPPPGPPPRIPNRKDGEQQQQPNFNGGYALEAEQAGFEGWHFSVSGRSAAVNRGLIENVVRDANPDIMLVELGFNDLGWFFSDEYGLIENMKAMIDNARRAQPNMRIIVGTVPHRTFIGERQDLITWAPFREEFDCGPQYDKNCPAAYDGLHPNEVGDFQIARAFSRALVSSFGIGSQPLGVRFDQFRSLPTPSGLQIRSSNLGVTATWDKIYGAHGYDVDYTINGGTYFQFSPSDVKTNRWDSRWAQDGWKYRMRVRARVGDRTGLWSGWVSAVARPQLPGVTRPQVTPLNNGFEVFLTIGTGPYRESLNGYYVYLWDKTDDCAFMLVAAFPGVIGPVYFDDRHGIKSGHHYWIAVAAINDNGEGFPAVGRTVIAGNTGKPGFPQNLRLEAFNGGGGIHATWNAAVNTGNYAVTRRLLTAPDVPGGDPIGETDTTCLDSFFEYPGTWNYRYFVFASNGDTDGYYERLVGPQAGDSSVRCPPPPQWCPPGSGGGAPPTNPIDTSDPPLIVDEADNNVGYALRMLSQNERLSTPVSSGPYYYLPSSGSGVDVYVLDSGINSDNIPGLSGKVITEFICQEGSQGASPYDSRDHGTRVASLIASAQFGSAKSIPRIYSYKIDPPGSRAPDSKCIQQSLEQVRDRVRERRSGGGYRGSVINLSTNVETTPELQAVVRSLYNLGSSLITTAGNDNSDSRFIYPCAYQEVICVGAVDSQYARWVDLNDPGLGSGYGTRITIFAPGVNLCGYNNVGNVVNDITGTSFAAPLVAGIVATYYGWDTARRIDLDDVRSLLAQNAQSGRSGLRGQSPDRLANNGYQKAGSNDDTPYLGAGPRA